jgi:hypothetical protein
LEGPSPLLLIAALKGLPLPFFIGFFHGWGYRFLGSNNGFSHYNSGRVSCLFLEVLFPVCIGGAYRQNILTADESQNWFLFKKIVCLFAFVRIAKIGEIQIHILAFPMGTLAISKSYLLQIAKTISLFTAQANTLFAQSVIFSIAENHCKAVVGVRGIGNVKFLCT